MKKINSLITIGVTALLLTPLVCLSANYPTKYQIFGAGYQKSMPLEKKLSIKQGEFFHKKTGFYFGANDSTHSTDEESPPTSNNPNQKDPYKLDAYAGLKHQIGIFGYHFGFKSYNQALSTDTLNRDIIDVQEIYVGGNIKALHLSYASNDEGAYTQLNFKHDLSNLTLGFHLGKTMPMLGEEFTDWSLYATKAFNNIKLNAIMTQSEDPQNNDVQFNLGVQKELSLF